MRTDRCQGAGGSPLVPQRIRRGTLSLQRKATRLTGRTASNPNIRQGHAVRRNLLAVPEKSPFRLHPDRSCGTLPPLAGVRSAGRPRAGVHAEGRRVSCRRPNPRLTAEWCEPSTRGAQGRRLRRLGGGEESAEPIRSQRAARIEAVSNTSKRDTRKRRSSSSVKRGLRRPAPSGTGQIDVPASPAACISPHPGEGLRPSGAVQQGGHPEAQPTRGRAEGDSSAPGWM